MGSLARLALFAGVWMYGCAAGAPEQVEALDPSMLGGGGGGGVTGGAGGAGGSAGKGGSGGSSSSGASGTGAPGTSGSPALDDGGLLVDGGAATDGGGSDQCSDTKKNGIETGTDCGGPDCDPCEDGTGCVIDSDCESEYCGSGFTCATPGCDDDARNGEETDVDCGGGDCPGCANGRDCSDDSDCMSDSCEEDKCACKPLEECGAMECGEKPDGCGAMVQCDLTCNSDEQCLSNACELLPAMCDPGDCTNSCSIGGPCCKQDATCGCRFLGFLGCD